MKRTTFYNIIMVAVITLMLVVGTLTALHLSRTDARESIVLTQSTASMTSAQRAQAQSALAGAPTVAASSQQTASAASSETDNAPVSGAVSSVTDTQPTASDAPSREPDTVAVESSAPAPVDPTPPSAPDAAEPTSDTPMCTIAIYCDTILDNFDLLDLAKADFVPSSGVLLQPTVVAFAEGETVFDVLRRVCTAMQMQLEYAWTPIYDSYYIEGIGHLYEFDCGSLSGWMYQVNGQFPNYGCSSFALTDGDCIEWHYTCQGLGADVGAPIR